MNKKQLKKDCQKQLEENNDLINNCISCGSEAKAFVTANWNFEIHCLENDCKRKLIVQSKDRNWKNTILRWNKNN